ncbi:MAG: L-rhamnose isomerase [Actinomycetota bacterium]
MDIQKAYQLAKESYAALGIDTDKAIEKVKEIPISIHCWQGDDVTGFEAKESALSGGILSTGAYPGKARNIGELTRDIDKAFSLIPGKKKLALHAMYGDFKGKRIDRDQIEPGHFKYWLSWAKEAGFGLDFNPTLFSHPKQEKGYTLASTDKGIRDFWIEHAARSREIAAYLGSGLGSVCINNIWIPDGEKDITPSKFKHRELLAHSLDKVLEKKYPESDLLDAVESKLFGIGYEYYTVGSNDFYLLYASSKNIAITYDTGHFHPTELVSDKISATLPFLPAILLHLSRGVRWDSDHVPVLNQEIADIMAEIKRADAFGKVHLATDFFDGSINRIGAWALGARTVAKALLYAHLEPTEKLASYEREGNLFARLALFENLKSMPFSAVWNHYLASEGIPDDSGLIEKVLRYEKDVLAGRDGK